MKSIITKNPLVSFVILTLGISWFCWIPIIQLIQPGVFSSTVHVIILLLLGGYGPSLAAIIISGITGGKQAIKKLFKRLMITKVGLKWYLVALMLAPIFLLVSSYIYILQGGSLGWINYQVILWLPVFYLVAVFFGPLGEELGWRGFLLNRLQKNYGFISSSLIVGVIWTFWHLPLYWAAEGTSISGAPVTFLAVIKYLTFVVGTSFIYTWVFKNTRGSVFMALLLHMSSNGIHTALGYFAPDLPNKSVIWNIEVFIYGALILTILASHIYKKFQTTNQSVNTIIS